MKGPGRRRSFPTDPPKSERMSAHLVLGYKIYVKWLQKLRNLAGCHRHFPGNLLEWRHIHSSRTFFALSRTSSKRDGMVDP
jgi:hypothetical protein